MKSATVSPRRVRVVALASAAGVALALGACSSSNSGSGGGSGSTGGGGGSSIGVSLITTDSTNPFFVTMQKGAKDEAAKLGNVNLTISSGKADGDEQGQIQAIENSIAAGDKGILITPNGPGVNSSIKKARDQGLYVIALDTPPDPADTVDITFATDNYKAGQLIGKWAAAQMKGKDATIALLDLFNDKVVSVDVNRDQGFLNGFGIDTADKTKNGDEAKTGTRTDGGGNYTIVCNEATNGATPDGKSAMERCLNKNPNINVVYTINEPAAAGAVTASGFQPNTVVVSVDGGCSPGVAYVKQGKIGATSQQYPVKMAQLGVDAIQKIANGGEKPAVSPGLSFYDTGVALVTDKPVSGLESITSDAASKICWGSAS